MGEEVEKIMASLGPSSSMDNVASLEEKKRGRLLLVGEDVESYVRQFLEIMAAAKGFILAKDASLLTLV